MTENQFVTWLEDQGFAAGSQLCQMFHSMWDTMLNALQNMQTVVQEAQDAVLTVEKARVDAAMALP